MIFFFEKAAIHLVVEFFDKLKLDKINNNYT